MANYQPRVYINSPLGTAAYAWINKPDTKFNESGVYKVDLVLGGAEATKFSSLIELEAKAALTRYFETDEGKKVPAAKRAKWELYLPFKEEEDKDTGTATGYTVFKFKQNAKIKLRDGTVKDIKVGIRDSKGKSINKPIFSGTELRVSFMFRDVVRKAEMQAGVQLAIGWVQIFKLAESTGGGQGKASVMEGGYSEEDEDNSSPSQSHSDEGETKGGDY